MQKSSVLIVEDDVMIADCLEEILGAAGFLVCGIARTAAEGIALGERYNPDLGVFDLCLSGGGSGTEVAVALRSRSRFGVLYVSGNPDHPLLQKAEGEACIAKPYTPKTIVAALGIVREQMSGVPLSAFPPGFRLLEKALAQPSKVTHIDSVHCRDGSKRKGHITGAVTNSVHGTADDPMVLSQRASIAARFGACAYIRRVALAAIPSMLHRVVHPNHKRLPA